MSRLNFCEPREILSSLQSCDNSNRWYYAYHSDHDPAPKYVSCQGGIDQVAKTIYQQICEQQMTANGPTIKESDNGTALVVNAGVIPKEITMTGYSYAFNRWELTFIFASKFECYNVKLRLEKIKSKSV